jgi:hypothetical protein
MPWYACGYAGGGGEHRHRQILRAARAARTIVDLSGCRPGGGDQVCRAFVRRLVVGDQSPLNRRNERHRFEILQDVPTHFGLQVGHHGHDAVVEASDCVAVRLGSRDLLRTDQPGRARQVHDHELLAHIVGHFLGHDPRGDVDSARRGQRKDHLDRPVGISCLRGGGGTSRDRKRQNEQ